MKKFFLPAELVLLWSSLRLEWLLSIFPRDLALKRKQLILLFVW